MTNSVDTSRLRHVGFIADGNRRWARERGLPTLEGHRRGFDKVEMIIDELKNTEVEFVSFYLFSTENTSGDNSLLYVNWNYYTSGSLSLVQDILKRYRKRESPHRDFWASRASQTSTLAKNARCRSAYHEEHWPDGLYLL